MKSSRSKIIVLLIGFSIMTVHAASPKKIAKKPDATEKVTMGCTLSHSEYMTDDGDRFPMLKTDGKQFKGSSAAALESLAEILAKSETGLTMPNRKEISSILDQYGGKMTMAHNCRFSVGKWPQDSIVNGVKASPFPESGGTRCLTEWASFTRNRSVTKDSNGEDQVVGFYMFEGTPGALDIDFESPLSEAELSEAKQFIGESIKGSRPFIEKHFMAKTDRAPAMRFAARQACRIISIITPTSEKQKDEQQ